ncbi:MAG: hypothetical protein IMW96_11230 [Thermoanaerobacteraceae bacterium]|uniref:hypothetical protein n=1 Tax=Thermanaeromonas sp. C210 TaxID=2731925 RepID=UPI00155D241F|nr:hypothetical protein [Thermanaeromonas sp. C210]MBE3582181.1 hypothetical protein [Thermoanaerobacteraceae bacterium]GFN23639.1 hypothetical protein TAMC210_19560 [Thermanaeromonas sp. C210]
MRAAVVKFVGLGFILGLLFGYTLWGWGNGGREEEATPDRPVMSSITASSPSPFDVIYLFYKAVEEGNGEKVRELVTPELWTKLQQEGFLEEWRARKNLEPELRFVLFLVSDQSVDEDSGRAWARGRAEWESPRRGLISTEETVHLVRRGETWLIESIERNSPLQAANEMYHAIEQADWSRLRAVLEPSYWRKLNAAGIISALKKDRRSSTSGVYVIFYINDYAVSGNKAWVKGDAIWHPLSPGTYETPVTLSLQKVGRRWLITSIQGHWEITK